jgi:NAD(P)-dependent dehydrogenase (short-subunit alcohol dehydrogenase family)
MPLEGRTAIVTGAASGIGQAIALQLAAEGADVAAADLNAAGAEATAAQVRERGRRGLAVLGDVADGAQVRAMVDRVVAEWGHVDILITCAGIFPRKTILEFDEDEWDRVIAVHLKGTFLCCRAVLPHMMEQRYGRIVTTVSGIALSRGRPKTSAYAAAKGGIISFTRALAAEAAPYGITVNAFGPGPTDTPMFHGEAPDHAAAAIRQTSFGRLGTPAEAAELAVWFTRPETAHVTERIFLR